MKAMQKQQKTVKNQVFQNLENNQRHAGTQGASIKENHKLRGV